MTKNKDLKATVRERMAKTGERYAAARRHVVDETVAHEQRVGGFAVAPVKGWIVAGSTPEDFEFGVDPTGGPGGRRAARLASRVAEPGGFGTLMQRILADDYRDRRVRWAGYVKTEAVAGWCGLWMRVDGTNNQMLNFDNMQSRALKGTADWQRCEIVLEVPADSVAVVFGVLLVGAGVAWVADVALEAVALEAPTTAEVTPRVPCNLSFEE
jgi:hypothetical protein